MQGCCTINGFPKSNEALIKYVSELVRIVIKNNIVDDRVMIVFHISDFLTVPGAAPINAISVRVVGAR